MSDESGVFIQGVKPLLVLEDGPFQITHSPDADGSPHHLWFKHAPGKTSLLGAYGSEDEARAALEERKSQ